MGDGRSALLRFDAVDGLRAWMAWGVVAGHIVNQSGLKDHGRVLRAIYHLGDFGVQTFIIISGFVITNLLLTRREKYFPFILRRFMRLFPALIVCCALGWACYHLASVLADSDWFDEHHREMIEAIRRDLPAHTLLHLTMLHGAIPNNVLQLSQYAFLPPAWSVSLEWQFYLIAPFVIATLRRPWQWGLWLAVIVLSTIAYRNLPAGSFRQPSLLLGNAHWFAIGIGSRLALERLAGRVRYPGTAAILSVIATYALGVVSIGFWLTAYLFLLADRPRLGSAEQVMFRIGRAALESAPVKYLAEQSYSTYLLHWPLMTVLAAFGTGFLRVEGGWLALWLTATVPAIVLVGQRLLFNYVEQPCNDRAKEWAAKLGQSTLVERHVETVADRP